MLPEGTPGNMYLGAKVSICRSSAPNVGTRCFARLLSPHVQGTRLFSMTQWLFKFDMIHSITSVADFKFVSLCLEFMDTIGQSTCSVKDKPVAKHETGNLRSNTFQLQI